MSPYQRIVQITIEERLQCSCSHVESVPVVLKVRGKPDWDGKVEVFSLRDHPSAERVFAWGYIDENSLVGYAVILDQPPVGSPKAAVKSAIDDGLTYSPFHQD